MATPRSRALHGATTTNQLASFRLVSAAMKTTRSRELQPRFRSRIPGGAHTYAKGDDQYPEDMPVYIVRGKGCHVWDVDGNRFIEYGMGLRSVTLGHAFPPVVAAARKQLAFGTNFVRPSPLELECADRLSSMIPTAEMVKFIKDGSSATSAAVRLSRAFTGRDMMAICRSDPFYSYDDWFIGTTEMSAGTLPEVTVKTVRFDYNDLASVERVFSQHRGRIACVIMEAERTTPPSKGFLPGVQELCRRDGALFILDEMITGFRWNIGGAQSRVWLVSRPEYVRQSDGQRLRSLCPCRSNGRDGTWRLRP